MTKEPPSDAVVTPFPPRQRYEAYSQALEVARVALRSGDELICIPYWAIGPIVYNFRDDTVCFSTKDWDVTIRGRNLRGLFDAMHSQMCSRVQEFDAEAFIAPAADDQKALVERIEISEPCAPEAKARTEKA